MGDFFISIQELNERMARGEQLRVFDVRRHQALEASSRFIPGSRWRNHLETADWIGQLAPATPVVVTCMHGHNVSQIAGAALREKNVCAQVLSDGIEAWLEAGYPSIGQSQLAPFDSRTESRWVSGLGAGIDASACGWLIRRFIDPDAALHFVEPEWVADVADELGAIAFAPPESPLETPDNLCFFDMILQFFDIKDAVLADLAVIIRAAATSPAGQAPEAAGLGAVLDGIAVRSTDDHQAVQLAAPVYDALYARQALCGHGDGISRGAAT